MQFVESSLNFRSLRIGLLSLMALFAPFGAGGVLQAADIGWSVNFHISLGETLYFDMETGEVTTSSNPGDSYDFKLTAWTQGTPEDSDDLVSLAPIDQSEMEGGVLYDFTEAKSFAYGTTIGAGSGDFWTGGAYIAQYLPPLYSRFPAGDTAYAGVAFEIAGQVHYGWVAYLRDNGPTLVTGTLTGFGYNSTPGANATAGAVPEPGTLGLLAAAGAALLAGRRRRR